MTPARLGPAQIRAMVAPALGGQAVARVERVEGGFTNTSLRVLPVKGPALLLRIFEGAPGAYEKETALLAAARAAGVPVAEVLHGDASRAICPRPFLVTRWIEGTPLDDLRARVPAGLFATVAGPLGELCARVAAVELPRDKLALSRAGVAIEQAVKRLERPRLRERLGAATADALLRRFAAADFDDEARVVVHGDLVPRNILVAAVGQSCRATGLLDWELAYRGHALWDAGSLFRARDTHGQPFRDAFERGHRDAGGALPADWYRLARLLDATRSIARLDEARAGAYAETRESLVAVAADWE